MMDPTEALRVARDSEQDTFVRFEAATGLLWWLAKGGAMPDTNQTRDGLGAELHMLCCKLGERLNDDQGQRPEPDSDPMTGTPYGDLT